MGTPRNFLHNSLSPPSTGHSRRVWISRESSLSPQESTNCVAYKFVHQKILISPRKSIMANLEDPNLAAMSFDFPEDVLLCILSFLTPSEIGSFCCTSKRFVSIGRSDSRLWYALCNRRWGAKTQIKRWGNGKISYKLLYKTLSEWEDLIGFWRRSGQGNSAATAISSPHLVFFEWGPSFITGSRVTSSPNGTYGVVKVPFLWLSLSQEGQIVNFIHPEGKSGDISGVFASLEDLGFPERDLVPVHVSFIGRTHLVVEENLGFSYNFGKNVMGESSSSYSSSMVGDDQGVVEDVIGVECSPPGSLQDRFMSEIYQYFANRTSPGTDRRRQRRREKERQGRRKWEPEHFVKIVNCSPTASRPLQGLWKGICDDMSMDFYLVAYDETGGISCRKVGDSSEKIGDERFSAYAPVFWTSNAKFIEYPLSSEEEYIYDTRIHLRPNHTDGQLNVTENEVVSHLLYINSSYDLVIPGTSANPREAEGRIWQYRNGTFGFGFLRDNFIIDLKHIAQNDCLLDTM